VTAEAEELRRELVAGRAQLLRFAEDVRDLYRQERQRARDLQRVLGELNDSYISTMETLAHMVEAKDPDTRRHLERTSELALAVARRIDPDLARRPQLAHGFLLHDIGKVGISERILTKAGPLTAQEWAQMQTHPLIGVRIVSPIRFLGDAVDVIRHHHEKFDGSGYPMGLRGREIPLSARIFSVADAFDAMTSDRPYRPAMRAEDAIEEIAVCSGAHFDPEVVDPFLTLGEELAPATLDRHLPGGE
jgi:HD-GYP domain-containing protein (c-di-GMP phosphodiesterase class II)